jgi:hypothetical protein
MSRLAPVLFADTKKEKEIEMKLILKHKLCWLFAGLLLAGSIAAAKPPRMPVYYEDQIVTMTVVNDNVVGVDEKPMANLLYSFGPPGNQPQFDVISEVPGEAGYSPWWEVISVVVLNGRDVTTNPFTSVDEILEAEQAGEVRLIETEFYFLCQILPGVKTP